MSGCPGAHTMLKYYTLPNGCPVENPLENEAVETSHKNGRSQLLQDINLIDQISHITRERIPERFVHAKGTGVKGHFKVEYDDDRTKSFNPSEFSHAKFLEKKGTETSLFARFSTVAGERGSADSVRDNRGFAFKLYTTEGNLDWLFFNPAVFPIRDPGKFTSMVHATKRDPASNLKDPKMFWDYFNHHPEGYNLLMRIFSDEGTPKAYTNCEIHSVNTYSFVKTENGTTTVTYVKIKMVPDHGMDSFNISDATAMAGADPDYLSRKLWKDINKAENDKNYPSWTVQAQLFQEDPVHGVMVDPIIAKNDEYFKKAGSKNVNIFDATRTVPEYYDDEKKVPLYPFRKFGRIVLTDNPKNAFAEVEQAAFSPANVVPGWDISPDPILQIRLFAYGDAQRYRLGPNADQLKTNRVKENVKVWDPTRRDGPGMYDDNYGDKPNYIGEVQKASSSSMVHTNVSSLGWNGPAQRFVSTFDMKEDYEQPREFWEYLYKPNFDPKPVQLSDTQKTDFENIYKGKDFSPAQKNFIYNVASDLYGAKVGSDEKIWTTAFNHFREIEPELGNAIDKATRLVHKSPNTAAFSYTMTDRSTGPVTIPAPGVPATEYVLAAPAEGN